MVFRSRYAHEYSLFAEPLTPAVRVLLVTNIVVFILRVLVNSRMPGVFDYLFGLSVEWHRQWFVWQLFTYMFLHSGPFHLLFNMLILYFLGTEIERTLGGRNFLTIYLVSGLLGGLGWFWLADAGICIGASGAVFGLLGAYVALFPQRYITVLVFFILPVTLRAWVLAAVLGGIEFLLMTAEVSNRIAHSAHLSGLLAGYLFVFAVFKKGGLRIRIRRGGRGTGRAASWRVLHREDALDGADADVDRILDKIAREGMNSLTGRERERLTRASAARRSRDGQ